MTKNMAAFLSMIAYSEGTSKIPGGMDGYRVIVGSTIYKPNLFFNYADHPRKLVQLGHGLASTAAGRYQVLARYFDDYKLLLHLTDFSPASQDAIAIQQLKECGALMAIESGHVAEAISRCAHIWASLPGANYNQHENSLSSLVETFKSNGGTTA